VTTYILLVSFFFHFFCFSAEGKEEEETERILPDDFYYDFDDLVSKAFATEGIPPELLSFQYPL